MKKILYTLALCCLFAACDKTENEQDIQDIFFGESSQPNTDNNSPTEPITIKTIEFANTDGNKMLTNWGGTLYANQLRFLYMRILYDCNTRDQLTVTLFVKIINPSGTLSSGTDSPIGYTMHETFTSVGNNKKGLYQTLGGWGNATQSIYTAGVYTIELWQEGDTSTKLFEITIQMR